MATPDEVELARFARGQKVVLHYTPPQIGSPQIELADHDQVVSDCAPMEAPVHSKSGMRTRTGQPCESALRGISKYTAMILDARHDQAFKHACAVFIVPQVDAAKRSCHLLLQGMELDWLVSTPEGQAQVVAGAGAARVFLVTLNRGHAFYSAEEVQKELSPWIRKLAPTEGLPPNLQPTAIPYTTTPQGIGHRTVLVETWSDINGPIVVEDVRLTEPGRPRPTTFRRMFFLDSPGLIQSEAVLLRNKPGESTGQHPTGTAHEGCEEEGDLHGTRSAKGATSSMRSAWREERSGEASRENEHRKKRRRRVEPLSGVSEALRSGLSEEAFEPKGLGVSGGGAREHCKKTMGRESDPSHDSRLAATLTEFITEAAEEFVELSDGLPVENGPQSEKRDGLAGCADTDQGVGATCLESEDTGVSPAVCSAPPERRANGDKATGTCPPGMLQGSVAACDGAVGELGTKRVNSEGSASLTTVDFSYLASDYLQAMVAGLAFLDDGIEDRTGSGALLDVLVIGLGGGALPMFLRRHLPCHVEVVEIDPMVVQLAKTYFGVVPDPAFQVHTDDAIAWVTAAAGTGERASTSENRRGSFDAVLIDVETAGGQLVSNLNVF